MTTYLSIHTYFFMKRVLLFSSLALMGMFSSCSDDKEGDAKPKSTSELLMAKSWTITAYTEKKGSAIATDEYASFPACFKDNIYKFEASNKFTSDESTLKCSSPQTLTGNWALSNNDKTLTAIAIDQTSFDDYTITGTVEEVSASKFVISQSETNNGVTTVTRTTFTAK